jgi:predicted ATPase
MDAARADRANMLATESHPIRRNPLFSRYFRRTNDGNPLALTRVLTSYQAALQVDSPKGLFLSGEVGTGKSMLLDLLADGLPNVMKGRWHFNTFMLETLSKLERFRTSHPGLSGQESEYSLLSVAKELIEKSPILFLDEFQLPDRAASKIMNHLFIAFFQLGGVLVASSNRMPEELEKATGGQYHPPPTGGLMGQLFGVGRRRLSGELYGQSSDFAAFLEVLKARCDFWHMEGTRDWRRREAVAVSLPTWSPAAGSDAVSTQDKCLDSSEGETTIKKPVQYFLVGEDEASWKRLREEYGCALWKEDKLTVYGRSITIAQQHDGVCYWEFSCLVQSFGPADYLTLASNYHTFIIDKIPILPVSMKNEARRFITFLDALYESRCKLVIRADAGPDDLFFPDTRGRSSSKATEAPLSLDDDAVYSETIAEVFQDQTLPFRPNVSTYQEVSQSRYNPDQDSDFGTEQRVDFSNTRAFTGEDERFAYKRATSRLWELCSSQWHGRNEDGWWRPLPIEARHWERRPASQPKDGKVSATAQPTDVKFGPSMELDEPVGLERFRIAALKRMSKSPGQR